MFGLLRRKRDIPKISYHKQFCECGGEKFRCISPLNFEVIENGGHTRKSLFIHDSDLCFECIKCGVIYNRYGKKEGE